MSSLAKKYNTTIPSFCLAFEAEFWFLDISRSVAERHRHNTQSQANPALAHASKSWKRHGFIVAGQRITLPKVPPPKTRTGGRLTSHDFTDHANLQTHIAKGKNGNNILVDTVL